VIHFIVVTITESIAELQWYSLSPATAGVPLLCCLLKSAAVQHHLLSLLTLWNKTLSPSCLTSHM